MDATIQVRKRGTLTLPAELRERYKIKSGDTFRLLDLDGIFVLTLRLFMGHRPTQKGTDIAD
jgi:bifunctional DNA-binding transcriptional regulator/antitoxin component of YhaV-PrlF toxin-antitoxin module